MHCASCTLFTNSYPWSVILTLQQPWRLKHQNKNSVTPVAVLLGSAVASGHLENKHNTLSMYLFPRCVSGRGPIMSTPMMCHTSPFTGIGWSSEENLSNFLLICGWYRMQCVHRTHALAPICIIHRTYCSSIYMCSKTNFDTTIECLHVATCIYMCILVHLHVHVHTYLLVDIYHTSCTSSTIFSQQYMYMYLSETLERVLSLPKYPPPRPLEWQPSSTCSFWAAVMIYRRNHVCIYDDWYYAEHVCPILTV